MGEVKNPREGQILCVRAGETLDVSIEVQNDNPYDQAGFYIITDLPADWYKGNDASNPQFVAALSCLPVSISLCPPVNVDSGNYPFNIRIEAQNSAANTPAPKSFVLSIERASVYEPQTQKQIEPDIHISNNQDLPDQAPIITVEPVVVKEAIKQPVYQEPIKIAPKLQEVTVVNDIPSTKSTPNLPKIPPPDADVQVIDPENMHTIHALPGQKVLIRFTFHNSGRQTCTYILDEDARLQLPQGWLDRIQTQVNLNPNVEGEIFCLIRVPSSASPHEYPFALYIGPQDSKGHVEQKTFTLRIQATPAVKIEAAQTMMKAGPFGHSADFQLRVSNAGNAETAFRMSIRSDEEDEPAVGDPEKPGIHESGNWIYYFDKEIDDLRPAAPGRPIEPRQVRLRIRRQHHWWWGFREDHTTTITAVPVTDASNGKTPGNATQVTIRQWRLLPFPYALLVPIVFLIIFLAGHANDLQVTNGLEEPGTSAFYVFGPPHMSANISWKAFPLAPQRLIYDIDKSALSILHHVKIDEDLDSNENIDKYKYSKEIPLSVKDEKIKVVFIPARTQSALKLFKQDAETSKLNRMNPQPMEEGMPVGKDKQIVQAATYKLLVPVGKTSTSLVFQNTDNSGTQVKVHYIPGLTKGSIFEISDVTEISCPSGAISNPIKIKALEPGTGRIILATTDATQQYIEIQIEAK